MRHALRSLRRSPWYAGAIVAVVAVTMALMMAVIAVVDGVLFKPLPYTRPGELFIVQTAPAVPSTAEPSLISGAELEAWSQAIPDIRFGSYGGGSTFGLIEGKARPWWNVGPGFLEVLGVSPDFGGFASEDFAWYDRLGSDPIELHRPVLITHEFWRSYFGGDPDVVGRRITMVEFGPRKDGFLVRGVLPASFVFPIRVGELTPDFLVPAVLARAGASATVIVRVPRGMPHFTVADRLAAVSRAAGISRDVIRLEPLSEYLGSVERRPFGLMTAGAAGLLLIGFINIAALTSARMGDRWRDLSIRRGLGASRGRLVRELAVESALLLVAGTVLALLVVPPLLWVTLPLLPSTMLVLKSPEIDLRLMAAAIGLCTLAIGSVVLVLFRIAWAVDGRELIGHGGSQALAAPRHHAARSFVTAQVALGCPLLVVGSLLVMSFANAWRKDTGFSRADLIQVDAAPTAGRDLAHFAVQAVELQDRLRGVPGVATAAAVEYGVLPDSAWYGLRSVFVPPDWHGDRETVDSVKVSVEFFDVAGLLLRAGRPPLREEWESGEPAAIVSEAAARLFWGRDSAVGRVLRRFDAERWPEPVTNVVTVIGVVADARFAGLDAAPPAIVYLPLALDPPAIPSSFLLQTTEPADRVAPRVAAAIRADSRFSLGRMRTVTEALAVSMRPRALPAWLFGAFAAAALAVLCAGVLGLVAMTADRRRREMAVRTALGARRVVLIRMLVLEQTVAVGIGMCLGTMLALWSARLVQAHLFELTPLDPRTWALAAFTLLATAAIGALVPSLRATRVDAATALRAE